MAAKHNLPSAAVSQKEYPELDDEIFYPHPEKVRTSPGGDSGRSAGAAEWVELPLESDPFPQTTDHIEPLLNNISLNHIDGHDVDDNNTELLGFDGSDSEAGVHSLSVAGTSGVGGRVRVSTLSLDSRESDNSESPTSPTKGGTLRRDSSILDGLLCEIYDRCQLNSRYSIDSDGFTEYSSNSEGAYLSSKGDSFQESTRLPKALINTKSKLHL